MCSLSGSYAALSVGIFQVYSQTVEPIIPYIFEKSKATCFAYGQTGVCALLWESPWPCQRQAHAPCNVCESAGSGKTYTMQPLPLRAAEDMLAMMRLPAYSHFQLWLSFFEIYGGKLFDLLNNRM